VKRAAGRGGTVGAGGGGAFGGAICGAGGMALAGAAGGYAAGRKAGDQLQSVSTDALSVQSEHSSKLGGNSKVQNAQRNALWNSR
jgi:hypothetical protein